MEPFLMDGKAYNVHVTKLTRKFSIQDSPKTGRVLSGRMYRDIVGTFYNYSMTVEEKNGDAEALDAFFDAISQPEECHMCVFPYGQSTLTQEMYVTSGEQDLFLLTAKAAHWGSISVNFIAMEPKVTP